MKHLIWGNHEAKYFFDEDWTGKISLKLLEKLTFTRAWFYAVKSASWRISPFGRVHAQVAAGSTLN
jgi:hypothetical protein